MRRGGRRHGRWVAGLAALAMGAAGCGAAAPSGASAPRSSGSRLAWSACARAQGPSGFQCATLRVPLDPAHPDGRTIGLALDRKRATGRKIGSLLVNPGGPGVSGVDALASLYPRLSPALRAHFDVVGFDPPGVGHSDGVRCLDSAGLTRYFHVDPAPTTPAGVSALIAANRTFDQGCEQRSGRILPYVSTRDAARDMDLIRAALGDAKLNYLGFSYGTFLGATYAELFPTHVRAMALDGAIDPAMGILTQLRTQSAALAGELAQFFSSCAASRSCAWKPGGPLPGAYQALLARVRSSPLPAGGRAGRVGPAELLYGTAAALYSTTSWPLLGEALDEAQHGDGSGLLALFDAYMQRQANGSYTDVIEAETAVNCLDAPAPSIAGIEAAAPGVQAAAGPFGLLDLYGEISCALWPVPATGTVHAIHAAGAPPIVVVGSTGDPITPYAWAQALASQLSSGVLLTRVGDGHTGYETSACERAQLDTYFLHLVPPPRGTRCPSGAQVAPQ